MAQLFNNTQLNNKPCTRQLLHTEVCTWQT